MQATMTTTVHSVDLNWILTGRRRKITTSFTDLHSFEVCICSIAAFSLLSAQISAFPNFATSRISIPDIMEFR